MDAREGQTIRSIKQKATQDCLKAKNPQITLRVFGGTSCTTLLD